MNLIVPISGKSSRYPNVKPKWMLGHPNGKFMAIQAISGFNLKQFDKVVFVYLDSHEEEYKFKKGFIQELEELGIDNFELCSLQEPTKDVTETVTLAIKKLNITGPILIKDSDSFFSCKDVPKGNFVFYSNLKNTRCKNPAGSSYITLDENNVITNIVEKHIISPNICVGGYLFESSEEFLEVAEKLKTETERYISDVIYFYILYKKGIFRGIEIKDLEDWGTLEDWKEYRSKFATLFLDIDGVIVEHSSLHFPPYLGESKPLQKNVDYIKSLDKEKVEIVFTTSRPEKYRDITEKQLADLGLQYKQLVMGLSSNKRIIVNDYNNINQYPNCSSINLKRNKEELQELLGTLL